jgi:predicted RNA-binding protein (virulence factor B family)
VIHTGHIQELRILRSTSVGLYLGDDAGAEVLLPNKYVPARHDQGSMVRVFVHRDSEDRPVATTLTPKILLDGFALLRVNAVTRLGAFLDMGLEKDLLVPFSEQDRKLEEGRWLVATMRLDERTDRLYGSTRIERYLDNAELTVAEGDPVELLPFRHSDLGWAAIVNGRHLGLLHDSDIFRPLTMGEAISGHVKQVRPDHKLDLTLQAPGYRQYNDANASLLAERLQQHNGFLPLTDKSPPEAIYRQFGISKKAFKQAVGALYKARLVRIANDGIHWTGPAGKQGR